MRFRILLICLIVVGFTYGADKREKLEVGRYQLETIMYVNKKGVAYIVETVLDTQTGKVVTRRKKKASSYKLPYKDRYGKLVNEE
tara:strand:- start:881 stop:1135 length:255 start_codon:yes stop_codon:yes gene_type:complete